MTVSALDVAPRTSDGAAGAPIRGPGEESAKPALAGDAPDRAAFGDLLRWAPSLLPLTLQSAGARGSACASPPLTPAPSPARGEGSGVAPFPEPR
jgi:hypothetical protein